MAPAEKTFESEYHIQEKPTFVQLVTGVTVADPATGGEGVWET